MLHFGLLTNLLLAVALGILLGLEREQTYQKIKKITFAGIRTFGLISLFGFVAAMIGEAIGSIWIIGIALLVVATFIMMSSYVSQKSNGTFGITTEMGALICFLVGVLVFLDYQFLAIATTIITFVIMSLSEQLHALVQKISSQEIYDTIKFAIIAFIVLPLLPNQDYGFLGLFNPYKIRLMVVFVSGIGFVGYILTRVIGTKKGIGLTGLIGGIVSSTAVATSLSGLSKKAKNFNPFVFGVIIASSIMFLRVGIEVYTFNMALFFKLLIPLATMTFVGFILAIFYFFKQGPKQKNIDLDVTITSPFALKPALIFGLFFAFIIAISKLSLHYLPVESLYFVSFFSGFADVDAITLSVASLTDLSLNTGAIAIMIAVIVNTVVKGCIAFLFGHHLFAKKIMIAFSIVILSGILSLFFL